MSLTITHSAASGTLLDGTSKGDGSIDALRGAGVRGWKWFRSMSVWGISHSRDRAPDLYRINASADALRAAGFDVDVQIDAAPRAMEEAETDRAERMEDRAGALKVKAEKLAAESDARYQRADEIAKRRPFGQPILVGHHSERGARADQKRIEQNMDKFCELAADSRRAEAAAEAAQKHMAHRENPARTFRRIEKLEADRRRVQRSLDGYTRRHLDGQGQPVYVVDSAPAEGGYREQLEVAATHLDEQLRYWREQLEQAKADGTWNPVDLSAIKPGDLIRTRFGWKTVAKVNRKTVSVETGYSWTDKLPIDEIKEHRAA